MRPQAVLATERQNEQTPADAQAEAERLVEEMRGLSMQHSPTGRSDGRPDPLEQRRLDIEKRFHRLGAHSVRALAKALSDRDVQMRRNAELVMIMLAGGYTGLRPKLDLREAIPALIKATKDEHSHVRGWAAHALAEIGPAAKPAIPDLIRLLADPEEGPRNTSCMALGRIGPPAKDALPALRIALRDPKQDVRRFAAGAIAKIEGTQPVRP